MSNLERNHQEIEHNRFQAFLSLSQGYFSKLDALKTTEMNQSVSQRAERAQCDDTWAFQEHWALTGQRNGKLVFHCWIADQRQQQQQQLRWADLRHRESKRCELKVIAHIKYYTLDEITQTRQREETLPGFKLIFICKWNVKTTALRSVYQWRSKSLSKFNQSVSVKKPFNPPNGSTVGCC